MQTKPNIRYSWISVILNLDNIEWELQNHMDPELDIRSDFKVLTANYLNSTFY